MIYPQNFESKIGFDVIREVIASHCSNSLGRAMCVDMHFSTDYRLVCKLLKQTNEYLCILRTDNSFPNGSVYDLREGLLRLKTSGTYLSETELFQLWKTIESAADINAFFNEKNSALYPELKSISDSLHHFPQISATINNILDKFGNVKDNASPELLQLRRKLMSVTSSINGMMQRLVQRYKQAGVLEKDSMPAIRDGRLVIPVAPMHKRAVKGIVHDESSSGKTFFIEPEEIVEANNSIRELEADIRREIIRILIIASDDIRPYIVDLQEFYEIIGVFDFIRAKAIFADEINATLPHISDNQEIEWYNATHPVLLMTLQRLGKEVVPLSITLNKQQHILLISGPNAGGKSVCLKTVGILQYMVQCGVLPSVYENSHFGIFNDIFIDIGDEQSIENELSTYSSHLYNMNYFMRNASDQTLLLIDEFGGGTEPQIGGAIAQGILKCLNDCGAFGVITTHYQNLKNFANDTPGIINGAMLYDRNLMKPLFQLSIGMPGSSFAIEIARKIGIPNTVIDYAEEIVGTEYINMDKYLLDIVRDRKYWQNKRQDIRVERKRLESLVEKYEDDIKKLREERRLIIHEAKSQAKDILAKSNASIENAIHEIKKVQAEKERTKEVRRQIEELKQRLSEGDDNLENSKILRQLTSRLDNHKNKKKKNAEKQPIVETKPQLSVGDNVTIDGSNSVGEIIEIKGDNAVVSMGIFKSTIALERLNKTLRKATAPTQKSHTVTAVDTSRSRQLNFKQELDVRGMRADEALQAVSYFIDDAVQFSIKQVRILHGTGWGILRQRIREYLNTLPDVKSFKDEHIQLGGAGITVIELY